VHERLRLHAENAASILPKGPKSIATRSSGVIGIGVTHVPVITTSPAEAGTDDPQLIGNPRQRHPRISEHIEPATLARDRVIAVSHHAVRGKIDRAPRLGRRGPP
jgi:hypothetical protein